MIYIHGTNVNATIGGKQDLSPITKFNVPPQNLHIFNFEIKRSSHDHDIFIQRKRFESCSAPSQSAQTAAMITNRMRHKKVGHSKT